MKEKVTVVKKDSKLKLEIVDSLVLRAKQQTSQALRSVLSGESNRQLAPRSNTRIRRSMRSKVGGVMEGGSDFHQRNGSNTS
jgi:hypothetical protein